MQTSVLIIAHNEERHLRKCIESILTQTQRPDEIVFVVHNSTDKTESIGREYPVRVIPYSSPAGATYARLEGLRHVSGDIILCIDGDSFAAPNWVQTLTEVLQERNNVLVGSRVLFKGNLFGELFNFFAAYNWRTRDTKAALWLWGTSLAFWKKDRAFVTSTLEKSFDLSKQAGLSRNPEDYWLALFMGNQGGLQTTDATFVTSHTKEKDFFKGMLRGFENNRNGQRARNFFKKDFV